MQAITALQRAIGNAAVADLLKPPPRASTEGETAGDTAGDTAADTAGEAPAEAAGWATGQAEGATGGMLAGLRGVLGKDGGKLGGASTGLLGGLAGRLGSDHHAGERHPNGKVPKAGPAGETAGDTAGDTAADTAGEAPAEAAGWATGQAEGATGGMLAGLGGVLGEGGGKLGGASSGLRGGLGGLLGGVADEVAGAGHVVGEAVGGITGTSKAGGGLLGGIGSALGGLFGSDHHAEGRPNGKAPKAAPTAEPDHTEDTTAATDTTAPEAAAPESGQEAPPAAAGASAGTAAAGGFDPSALPPTGETVRELPQPAEPSVGALGRVGHRPKPVVPPKVGDVGTAPQPAEQGGFEHEAHGIEESTRGAGGGGILDTIIQAGISLLGQITGGIAGTARGIAGAVGGKAGSTAGEVAGTATTDAQSAATEAEGAAASTGTEASEHVGAAHTEAQGAFTQIMSMAKDAPSQASGQMEGLVGKVLEGAPAIPTLVSPFGGIFTRVLGALPGLMMAALTKAESFVSAKLTRATENVSAVSERLQTLVGRAGAGVEAALDWVAQQAASLRATANERLAQLPSIVRTALSAVVDGLLGAVAGTTARIAARARMIIDFAVKKSQAFLQATALRIIPLIDGLRVMVTGLLSGLRSRIIAAIATINALRKWLLDQAAAFISRALRAVIGPIYQRAYDRLMKLIGPEVRAAMTRAQLMFPNGLPPPPEVVEAATKAADETSQGTLDHIKQGLLNPEGDHFSIGLQLGISGGAVVGGAFSGGASLEVVFDYRRNDIGFFLTPAIGGQGNLLDAGATGSLSGVGAWGTVGSFGEPGDDVIKAWSGWFGNATYGYQGGLAYLGGIGVASGGSIYRSGTYNLPLPGTHTEPGPKEPDKVVPAKPPTKAHVDFSEVHFGSQRSDAEAEPSGPEAMDRAAQQVKALPEGGKPATVDQVIVVGEASRIWKHPRPGKSRASENDDLAMARANSVKAGLDGRLGGNPPVAAVGAGDQRAALDGKPVTDGNADYRRALIFADVTFAGTPEQVIPGGQGPDVEKQNTVPLPNPFTSDRTAWGWDTTLSVAGLVGEEGKAGVFAGGGVSYSIPLGKTNVSHDTMEAIRLAFATVKITGDIISLSPLGLLRDIVAAVNVEAAPDAAQTITYSVSNWTVPMPRAVEFH